MRGHTPGMIRGLIFTVLVVAALQTSGCAFLRADRIHYTWDSEADIPCATCAPVQNDTDFVGVALSGGGARASVFGAAALEVLADAGVMEQVTHISSVSGGGFASSYYVLYRPTPCAAFVRPGGELCRSESFTTFNQAMRHNFLTDMTLRQVARPNRFSSPTRRLSSLQDALDTQFINGATFGDLPPSPVLLANGARYDDARRFVFSNAKISEGQSNIEPFTEQTLRTASFSLPGCTRATPKDFSVALAIAISAGFPPLLGPAAIEMPMSCAGGSTNYWHLGDGGILDNTGVETLEDFALHASTNARPVKRVVIFSMDAGRSTSADAMMQTRNLKLWTSDPGRVVDIVGKRASAYREIAISRMYEKSGASFHVLKMRYTDARIDTWPASCEPRTGGVDVIAQHLAQIPTNLRITECDADLMELAAQDVVGRALTENRALLQDLGLVLSR